MNRHQRWDPARMWLAPVLFPSLALAAACSDSAAPDPVVLDMVSGDAQEAPMGTQVAEPLVVRVTDLAGEPRSDVPVEWAVLEGTGSLVPVGSLTDEDGTTAAHWTLGGEQGEQHVEATAHGERVVFGSLATPEHPDDWADMVGVAVAAHVEGDSIRVELTLTSEWPGTLRLRTPSSCLSIAHLYEADGTRAPDWGFQHGCLFWVVHHTLRAGESLRDYFETSIAPLDPGTYTVRIELEVDEINGEPTALPDGETEVVVE